MIRSILRAGPLAALLTIPLLSLVTPAYADEDRWLHVAVDGEDRVRLNLPLSVVTAAMPLIEAEGFSDGHIRINEMDMDPEAIVALLRSIADADDGEYVTIESEDDDVTISKKGEYMYIHVQEDSRYADRESVEMKFPIPVLTALVSGEDDELNLMAALDALADYEGEDLVTVNDDGTSVRIWVDQKSTQNN